MTPQQCGAIALGERHVNLLDLLLRFVRHLALDQRQREAGALGRNLLPAGALRAAAPDGARPAGIPSP